MVLCALLTTVAKGENADTAATPKRPNIVFILIDDLGWADLGCYGSTYHETPRIDALAATGMKFTDFYAVGPVCSPTRASIVSGQYPARLGLTNFISGKAPKKPDKARRGRKLTAPPNERQLPLEIVTFAERLQNAGYRTGYFGKWHLGKPKKQHSGACPS